MDEYIRLDTTAIGINNLIAKASNAEEANALFKAKDVIYSQQRYLTYSQPEPTPVKHGRWIYQNRNDEDGRHIYRCSECDFEVRVFPCNFISWKMHEKCCAGCGARMDGDSDDQT